MNNTGCAVCNSKDIILFKTVSDVAYFECLSCEVIFASHDVLAKIDAGSGIVDYSDIYWKEELYAARERSWGTSLARVAEVFLYSRIPITKFIDIGSGPGYLLDALQYQLPSSQVFYANELFPPDHEHCTTHKNYLKGPLQNFEISFDAGSCVEVIEHLTPSMVKQLFSDLAKKSRPNGIFIFNTGLSHYIKNEDIGYLDPYKRGHIVGWSIRGLQVLVGSLGFQILSIPGKSWAFLAEYRPDHNFDGELQDRIWRALPENVNTLRDKKTGDLMYILGLDTVRAYS